MAIITAANEEESSYAATYDEELGSFLSDEFSNAFISLIDENPSISIGELFQLFKSKQQISMFAIMVMNHLHLFRFQHLLELQVKLHIIIICQVLWDSKQSRPMQLKKRFLSVRAKARLQILKNKALTLKLETALGILVKYVDPKNYEFIMKDTKAKMTPN